ncbi:hypothetical protein [Noviherbaspirillum pedocola]|uniref:Uncharacterized protein n=1 Tax=Noviherbaspirillum pedocola TaxID=2801341 RepID=A0A934SN07_9BURK|nr:hypothetical protein [Noviherbaspirillum pedocola]MBK4733455.1 hypothetical protein [Noviherbaspirillum pedocola]
MRAHRILPGIALAAALFSCLPAQAMERMFPNTAKRGTLSTVDYPTMRMDGAVRKFAPGAWIRNQFNTVDVPASLGGREFTVNYTENPQGDIDRVWILTPEEATKPAPAQSR